MTCSSTGYVSKTIHGSTSVKAHSFSYNSTGLYNHTDSKTTVTYNTASTSPNSTEKTVCPVCQEMTKKGTMTWKDGAYTLQQKVAGK